MFKFVCDYKEGIRMLEYDIFTKYPNVEYDIFTVYPNILITSYFIYSLSKPFPRHHLFKQLYFINQGTTLHIYIQIASTFS